MNSPDDSRTISACFLEQVARRPDETALGYIRGSELNWLTWREVADAAGSLAAEIRAASVAPGDRVAQVSENRYEWIITDLALHLVGAVHVPIHVTLSAEQIAEQIIDCNAKLVFVSNEDVRGKLLSLIAGVPIRVHAAAKPQATDNSPQPPAPSPRPQPTDLATILYTSGTTGRPRGVMLSHHNLATNAAAVCQAHRVDSTHTLLCILPLSHIYARTCDFYTWVCSGSKLVLAESRETLTRDCQLVKPSALNAVPFVYQRIMEGVGNCDAADKPAALRAVFGGQIEMLFCGGAPLAPDVEAWYAECGLPILPGYGMTELSPVVAVTTREARRLGSVGTALPGVETRIAGDGEILVRGPNVMLGYWQNADATANMIRDGWLHTGDLGELDSDGFLFIRGRKKELIVLSTGKKVVPTRVESMLTASPLIDQAAVFGEGLPALIALIVPSACGLAKQNETGPNGQAIAVEIEHRLHNAAHEEHVRQFAILDRPFSIERGELTPKLSLCRTVIAKNFAKELQATMSQRTQKAVI